MTTPPRKRIGSAMVRRLATLFFVPLVGLSLASSGCKCSKDEDTKKEKTTAAASKGKQSSTKKAPKKASKAPKKAPVDKELVRLAKVVKTEEDFEAAAEKEIALDNLEQKVDELEKELSSTAE
jgi:hypothetical protein